MRRREFLAGAAAYLGATAFPCLCSAQWPTPTQAGEPTAIPPSGWPTSTEQTAKQKTDVSTVPGAANSQGREAGCSLRQGAIRAMQDRGVRLSPTSGFGYLDNVMPQEAELLSRMFEVHPGFAFFDDGGDPNAFAVTDTLIPGTSGTVLFGLDLLRKEVSSSPVGGNALIMIMAHEWGHIAQFTRGLAQPGKQAELSADFLGGWWLGMKRVWNVPALDWDTAARSIFSKGDYAYNSPTHHGTPEERVSMMTKGYTLSAMRRILNPAQAVRESLLATSD